MEPENYTLTTGSENSNMGIVEVTLTAKSIEGFEFDSWSDGSTENPRTIILAEDTELYARFRIKDINVNLEISKIISANVYGGNGVLYVEGVEYDYYVFDASGRLIYTGRDAQLQLPRGVYVIAVDDEVQKVIL